MPMQHLYRKLNVEDQKVYTAWVRKVVALWALILVAIAAICTILTLDVSVTPEQRIATQQQSAVFP